MNHPPTGSAGPLPTNVLPGGLGAVIHCCLETIRCLDDLFCREVFDPERYLAAKDRGQRFILGWGVNQALSRIGPDTPAAKLFRVPGGFLVARMVLGWGGGPQSVADLDWEYLPVLGYAVRDTHRDLFVLHERIGPSLLHC